MYFRLIESFLENEVLLKVPKGGEPLVTIISQV